MTHDHWEWGSFHLAMMGGAPVQAHGYLLGGLALMHDGWALLPSETRWTLLHIGSGFGICTFVGDVATVFPAGAAVARCTDWTLFDMPGSWRQIEPELPQKIAAVLEANPQARPNEWRTGQTADPGPERDDAARAVIQRREEE